MTSFSEIEARAIERHGEAGINARLMPVKSSEDIAAISDDRWLSQATRGIFQAGFSWKVIDQKWDNFEAAFNGFNVHHCATMTDEDLDILLKNTNIVRNAQKLVTVGTNATYFKDLITEHGSVGAYFATWQPEAYLTNLDAMKARTKRLGGTTGQYFLRTMGLESLIFSKDVVAALIGAGVVTKMPTSKRDLATIQDAVNEWRAESGKSLTYISQILGLSV